jgi:predicted ATPase
MAIEHAEAVATLSQKQGFTLTGTWGTILRCAALAELGHGESQVRVASEAMANLRNSGTELSMPCLLAMLAEIHGRADQTDDALSVLGDAIEMSTRRGERWYEAELHRLKGEMTLQSCDENPAAVQREAEDCFEKALEIARDQSAKSWELRAATSLARLWQQQGKKTEAHRLLSHTYNWFTEGFDTKDLQDAKALLEALG